MDQPNEPSAEATVAAATTAAFAATAASVVMIAQQVAGRATRDALFLTAFNVKKLPGMVLIGAILSLLAVRIATHAMARYSPAVVAPIAFGANALLFFGDWVLAHLEPRVAAVAIYVHISLCGATVISIFWSLVSERFDPHTCKKLVGRIGAGGTAGGIVGGLIAWNTASLLSVRSNLAVMGLMNLICMGAVLRIAHRTRVESGEASELKPARELLKGSHYLQLLACLVLTVALVEAMTDYLLNAAAAARFHSGPSLLRFFSIFHTLTALVTFGLQMGFARRSLNKFGPAGAVALLPGSVLAFGALAFQIPALWTTIMLRGGETALSNSLFRSGYELFYTPLSPETKRPTKTLIDVGGDRVGTMIGSGLTLLVLLVAPIDWRSTLIIMAMAISVIVLLLARRLHGGYIGALAESLKEGEAALAPATTMAALLPRDTHSDLKPIATQTDAGGVHPAIALVRPSALTTETTAQETETTAIAAAQQVRPVDEPVDATDRQRLLDDIDALLTGDRAKISALLVRPPALDVRLVVHVLPLLGHDKHAPLAVTALRTIATRCIGQLVDVLIDSQVALEVRRRLPSALRASPTQRAAQGLVYGLADASFEVRYQCGLALLRVTEKNPEIHLPPEELFAAVLREIQLGRETWDSRLELEDDGDEDFQFMDAYLRLRTSRGLQYVFALLSVALEREPIRMAFHALSTDDQDHRGTALEYLENVLPEDIAEALWPYLGDRRAFKPARRSRTLVVNKLLESSQAIASVLETMRKQQPRASSS